MQTWLGPASSSRRTRRGSFAAASICRPAAPTSTPDRSTSSPASGRRTDGSGTSAARPCAKASARRPHGRYSSLNRKSRCKAASSFCILRSLPALAGRLQNIAQLAQNPRGDLYGAHRAVRCLLHADRGDPAAADHDVAAHDSVLVLETARADLCEPDDHFDLILEVQGV